MAHYHRQNDSEASSRLLGHVEDLEKENKRLRRENESLRQTAKDLELQLSENSIQLVQLQGSTKQITDVQIRGELEIISGAIREWTTDSGRVLKKHEFWKVYAKNIADDPGGMVDQILNFPSSRVPTDMREWFQECLEWLGNISTCPYIVLERVIWSFLAENLFSARFPIGLTPEDEDLITKLTSFMDPSHNNREGSSAPSRTWRTQTLHAMSKTDKYKAQRKKDLHRRWDQVVSDLEDWFPDSIDTAEWLDDFQDKIFGPAAELQQSLALSAYEYDVKPPEPLMPPGTLPDDSLLSTWSLINARTWISEDVTQALKGILLVLSPGIVRRRLDESGKDVTMLKPTVVVLDDDTPDLPLLPVTVGLPRFFDRSRVSRTPDIVDSDYPPLSSTPRGRSSPKRLKESDLFQVSEDEYLDRERSSTTRAPSGSSGHRRRPRDTRPSRPQSSQEKEKSSSEKSSYDLKKKVKEPSWMEEISVFAQAHFRRRDSHPASSDQRRRGDGPGAAQHPPRAATDGTRPAGSSFGTTIFSDVPRTAGMDRDRYKE